ncbi:glycosyltransferase family 2 protein [filamentous cyanobacterium LEGE 11480]|uniref:Beta-monoglucosyldiacylglycerol synthase n=1 Tax=Romeriopsis navalis LEGE 11480 TaxID=2777977 RepID=A0A928VMY2_9CYAN|nr:glycosyltransferase family 2 protein [Romeriopsis navalis]MBE9031506.1 glycosyltransferase family 2 protein [Romeriopsis navalis LEGE 11480]
MSEKSWPDDDSFSALNPSGTLAASPAEDDFQFEIDPAFLTGLEGRRLKSALMLGMVWGGTIALHQFTWGYWLTTALAALMGGHCLRAYATRPRAVVVPMDPKAVRPQVTLMVAAKNEEAVVDRLVDQLCNLDYPRDRYEVWFIDDASTDQTPAILDRLALQHQNLRVVHRPAGSPGGKSGALNQVFPRTVGEFIVVFDADAQIAPDFLDRSLPAFDHPSVGAVQLRKAIIQAETPNHPQGKNFWIQGQQAEMALDAFMRQQQIAVGGIGELRGNGQLVRRQAIEDCGGWNEGTITDDLDLSLRLHLNNWDIECLTAPAVYEEGVTQAIALWHQRSRWAEGGYQRYLDYWRMLVQNRLGLTKSFDLVVFVVMQYIMPMVAVPDLLMAVMKHQAPVFTPITIITFGLFFLSAVRGLRRSFVLMPLKEQRDVSWFWLVKQSVLGAVYMAHWLPVIAFTTARMAVRKKRLKWVKTAHSGQHA